MTCLPSLSHCLATLPIVCVRTSHFLFLTFAFPAARWIFHRSQYTSNPSGPHSFPPCRSVIPCKVINQTHTCGPCLHSTADVLGVWVSGCCLPDNNVLNLLISKIKRPPWCTNKRARRTALARLCWGPNWRAIIDASLIADTIHLADFPTQLFFSTVTIKWRLKRLRFSADSGWGSVGPSLFTTS